MQGNFMGGRIGPAENMRRLSGKPENVEDRENVSTYLNIFSVLLLNFILNPFSMYVLSFELPIFGFQFVMLQTDRGVHNFRLMSKKK